MLRVFYSSISISNAKAFYVGSLLSFSVLNGNTQESELCYEFKIATHRTSDSVLKTLSVQDCAHKIYFSTFEIHLNISKFKRFHYIAGVDKILGRGCHWTTLCSQNPILQSEVEKIESSNPINFSFILFKLIKDN